MANQNTIKVTHSRDALPEWAEPAASLGSRVLANPLPVVVGIIVVVVCLVVGGLVTLARMAADREAVTQYAEALFTEGEEERLPKLEAATQASGMWGVEATYMAGEEALKAGNADKARSSFESVVTNHSDSPLAPRAAEALAFLDETAGAYEQALEGYNKVEQNWPDSFAAKYQPYNIGRVQETMGDWKMAVAAYQRQSIVFPDSKIAKKAEIALERLRISHPDAFPAAAEAPAAEPAISLTPETGAAETAPATEAAPTADGAVAPAEESAPAAVPAPAPEAAAPPEAAPAESAGEAQQAQ